MHIIRPRLRADDSFFVAHSPDDTIGDLKKLIAAQTGTKPEKVRRPFQGTLCSSGRHAEPYRAPQIVLKKWYTIYKGTPNSLLPRVFFARALSDTSSLSQTTSRFEITRSAMGKSSP